MKVGCRWLRAVLLALVCGGCLNAAPPGKAETWRLPVVVIYTGGQCGAPAAGAEWILAADRLESVFGMVRRGGIPDVRMKIPVIDFERFGILYLAMGARPTSGYRLALANAEAVVQDGTAAVRVDWVEPSPGALASQVITSPCLLIRLPRGDFHRIDVVDGGGIVRFRCAAR